MMIGRLNRLKRRLPIRSNTYLGKLFGVHRNAVSYWMNGVCDMTEHHYRVLRELERQWGLGPAKEEY